MFRTSEDFHPGYTSQFYIKNLMHNLCQVLYQCFIPEFIFATNLGGIMSYMIGLLLLKKYIYNSAVF